MLILCLGPQTKCIPRMSWLSPTENVVTKWVTMSCVLNKMSPSRWLIHQLFQSHDHLIYVRELIWASFQSWVLVTETVGLGSTVHSQKKSWLSACIKLSLSVRRVWLKHSHVVFGMPWPNFIEYQQWASSHHGYVHCFRWWTSRDTHEILQHC